MSLITRVSEYIKKHHLIPPHSTIIVGLSGGPDSVFLLHCLHALASEFSFRLIATHLNHEWRESAVHDVMFCKALTKQLKIPLKIAKASDFTVKKTGSKEDYGRRLRRHFLETIAQEYQNCRIALGHHQDDNLETFYIRLIRGSGLRGLTGMRPQQGLYIRPLLEISREDIEQYLREHALNYRVDETNEDLSYLRNRLRHKLIPLLTTIDNRHRENTLRTMQHLQEVDDYLTSHIHDLLKSCLTPENKLSRKKLLSLPFFMQKQIILQWLVNHNVSFTLSEAFLEEILRFIKHPGGGNHKLNPLWSLKKKNNYLSLSK